MKHELSVCVCLEKIPLRKQSAVFLGKSPHFKLDRSPLLVLLVFLDIVCLARKDKKTYGHTSCPGKMCVCVRD